MKSIRLVLSFLLFAVVALAASAPVVTDALVRIQTNDGLGSATAFFEKTTVVEGQTFVQPWEAVSWSTTSTRTITYTFGGQSYTQSYAQVMAAVTAIANQERTNPTPPASP